MSNFRPRVKKPVGILHVKIIRASQLSKKDILGSSDPYVKLRFCGERFATKRTSVKMNNLNPVWNETFKLIVKDPQHQALELRVFDWDKVHISLTSLSITTRFGIRLIFPLFSQVGGHDRIGMQLVPLKLLTPNETKEFTVDLVKNTNANDPQNKKKRGQIMVELTFAHFKADSDAKSSSEFEDDEAFIGGGVLLVTIHGAEDVEGDRHNNPFALVHFRGDKRKTKVKHPSFVSSLLVLLR